MAQIISDILAHLPQFFAVVAAALATLSALSKALEGLSNMFTGKPQIVISEVDGFLLKAIGVLQSLVDWLAPRSATPNPPASSPK